MVRAFIIVFLFLVVPAEGPAQEYIGLTADEVREMMRQRKDFHLDETTVNKVYRYLKYVDDLETRTILFFLSDEDVCTFYKEIYENSMLKRVQERLDSTCRRVADTLWVKETAEGKYEKELKRQSWFFSVTTRPLREELTTRMPDRKKEEK